MFEAAKRYVADIGFAWDEDVEELARPVLKQYGVKGEAAESVGLFHAWAVAHAFDASRYPFRSRLAVAVHFLLGRKLEHPWPKGL